MANKYADTVMIRITCECGRVHEIKGDVFFSALGRLGGSRTSKRKKKSSRENIMQHNRVVREQMSENDEEAIVE